MASKLDPREELIADTLPRGEVSLLAGASGAGKTTLIMQILRSLQRGEDVFGHEACRDLRIGYIAADRTWRSYCRTAEMVGLDLSKLQVRAIVDDPAIDLRAFEESPIDELERLIRTMLPLDLLVVDPLVVFLGVDTNKYHLNAARLIRLNKLCLANDFTILGTHHATKARTDYGFKRAQDRISGTSALLGFPSTQLFLASPEELSREDGCYEWHVISHHAPSRVVLLSRGEGGQFRLVQEEVSRASVPLEERVLTLISDHRTPITTGEIISAFSAVSSVRSIERVLGQLLAAGYLSQPHRGVYQMGTPRES